MTSCRKDVEYLRESLKRDLSDGEKHLVSSLDSLFLLDFLESDGLEALLDIYLKVSSSFETLIRDQKFRQQESSITGNVSVLIEEIRSSLSSDEWMSETQQLCEIFTNRHFSSIVRAYDAILKIGPSKDHQESPISCLPHNPISSIFHHEYDHVNVQEPSISSRSTSQLIRGSHSVYQSDLNQPIYQSIDSHLPSFRLHHYEYVQDVNSTAACDDDGRTTTSPDAGRFYVKQVQIVKGEEPLGITVKPLEQSEGAVMVTRVLYGGSAHRSGLVSVGDVIFEVNNINLKGKRHGDVVRLLERESLKESISFKLLISEDGWLQCPRRSNNNILSKIDVIASGIFMKSHFDYNPFLDRDHPCPEGGLVFKRGDVLEIVNQEDDNWWQARHEEDLDYSSRAAIIPSMNLQEKRLAALRDLTRQRYLSKSVEFIPGIRSPIKKATWSHRVKKVMYKMAEAEEFEENDLPTYEEVIHLFPSQGYCRPIVIFGSDLIGRAKLIRRLRQIDRETYKTPVAHTTRMPREIELDGGEYFFVTKEWFKAEIEAGSMVEYEEYKGNLYGIHRETIRSIIASGCICILSLKTQGLKAVRNGVFKPFVVFLKPDPSFVASCSCPRRAKSNEYIDGSRQALVPDEVKLSVMQKVAIEKKLKEYRQPTMSKVKRNHLKYLTDEQKEKLLYESSRLEYLYAHYFDVTIIVEDDLSDVLKQLIQITRSVQLVPQWAPASWL